MNNGITDNNISLIEDTHQYVLKNEPDIEFTSATTLVHYFFKQFDTIGIANNLTTTNVRYINMSPQELVAQWDKIAETGSIVHAEIESFIKDGSLPSEPKSKRAVEWIKNKFDDKYDLFSEVIVYSKELKIAGTIDLLLFDKEDKSYKILDWKTSKRIFTSSYNSTMGHHKASAELMDCNFIHYSLQLSLYQYLLENFYGLNITGSAIIHIGDDQIKSYKTEYFKNEIENMLEADREALKQKAENSLTKEFISA